MLIPAELLAPPTPPEPCGVLAEPAALSWPNFPPDAKLLAPACADTGPCAVGLALSDEAPQASRLAKNSDKSSNSDRVVIEARAER